MNCFGRKGNRLTNEQTKVLKLTPKSILRNGVTNLNLRNLPCDFTQDDISLMTQEISYSRIVVNIPYNRMIDTFYDYAFVLVKDSHAASKFCKDWNKKFVTGALGNVKRIHFHQSNQSPKEFLIKILRSKSVFDIDPKKRPCFYLDTKDKAKYFLSILGINLEQFIEQFGYLRVNSDFDIFFGSSSL